MDTHFREPDTFVQFSPKTRNNIEQAIEGLLNLLDQMDPDADFESDGTEYEPTLGWPESDAASGQLVPTLSDHDEAECDRRFGLGG